jgi:hypothetical protein
MRASWLRAFAQWGLLATMGTAGVVACGSRPTEGFTAATRTALPFGVYPASARMTQKYGIVEWRVFAGRSQLVITGFRADGSPARGMQLASFKAAAGSPAHVRLMMLDGTGAAVRRTVTGAKTGSFSAFQNELLETMRYDLQRSPLPSGGTLQGSASEGPGLHVLVAPAPAPGSGVRPADGVGLSGGTTPGTGPECTAAWNDPQIVIDGSGCILGAATFEDGVGGLMALATCGQWYTGMKAANATCSTEDAASCNSDNPPTCNFSPSSPEAAAPAPQSSCDTACLCANYPDTAQGCNTNYGPCTSDTDCSGGYTCQAGQPGASHTCQAPQADAGASGDDAGAGGEDAGAVGDDAGAATGDDAGAAPGDDAGGTDPSGNDGGTGDPAGDPSGDDGGPSDPESPPTEQQVDDSADNTTCPSCQGAGSDLSADPQNGNVAVASPGSDPSSTNPSTSDTNDDPAGGSSGGAGTGSNGGGSSGSSSNGSSSTGSSSGGDDGTGQASEDQSSQDQSSQDQSSQDQSSQDQSSQDQPSQDQASQDQSSQDAQDQSAIRRLRHHHHKPSGWRRLYDRIAGWLRD